MTTSRGALRSLLVVLLAALTACSSDTSGDSPSKSPEAAPEVTVDLAAAALPNADQLPEGFELGSRCPGGSYCPSSDDADQVLVSATTPKSESDEVWGGGSLWLHITVHDEAAAATKSLSDAEDRAKERDGDYKIKVDKGEGGSFTPGEDGNGSYADYAIGDWEGLESLSEFTYNGPISDKPSAPRQASRITLVHDNVQLECNSQRLATAGKDLAKQDCRTTLKDVIDRLADLDPDTVERVMTPRRLGQAFPAEGDFPKGSAVRINCPLEKPCEDDETYDASLSVDTALPAGVAPAGKDDYDRFRIKGGEWSEDFTLEVTLKESEKAARKSVTTTSKSYRKQDGPVDTRPEKTDTGYDYGVHGTAKFVKIGGKSWTGALRVYDATLEHLDGRVGDRRYYINFAANSGAVFVEGLSNVTPQGRTQQQAIDFVKAQLEGYFSRLTVG